MLDVQTIRLLDVFLIAPIMFYVAVKVPMPRALKWSLLVIATATLVYNGQNYLEEYDRRADI